MHPTYNLGIGNMVETGNMVEIKRVLTFMFYSEELARKTNRQTDPVNLDSNVC